MSDLFNQPTFETWYCSTPRKVGKAAAQKAYKAALKTASPQILQDAVEAYAAIWHELTGYQGKKGKDKIEALKFCPHPATWLNGGRWEDEEITEYLARPLKPLSPLDVDLAPDDPHLAERRELIKRLGPAVYSAWLSDMQIDRGETQTLLFFPKIYQRQHVQNNFTRHLSHVFGDYRCRDLIKNKGIDHVL